MGSGGPAHQHPGTQLAGLAAPLSWQWPAGPSGSRVVQHVPKWQGRLATWCVGPRGGSGLTPAFHTKPLSWECVLCQVALASCWAFCSLGTLDRSWGLSGLCFLLLLPGSTHPQGPGARVWEETR